MVCKLIGVDKEILMAYPALVFYIKLYDFLHNYRAVCILFS
jgi:hypothetical protein